MTTLPYLYQTGLGMGILGTLGTVGLILLATLVLNVILGGFNALLMKYTGTNPKDADKQLKSDDLDARINTITGGM